MSDPLWVRAQARSEDDPEISARAAHRFMVRCARWGREVELPKLRGRVCSGEDPADAARLHQWTTWVAFCDHALREIETGRLDDWFEADAGGGPGGVVGGGGAGGGG